MEAPLKVLVVDDERLARLGVARLVNAHPLFVVTHEAANGEEALELLREHAFDLVFLDVEMPECNGFELLTRLDPVALPPVIFVTAYDQYAVRAFEAHALDYLLKPLDPERMQSALVRVLSQHGTQRETTRLRALLADLGTETQHPEHIAASAGGRTVLVPVQEVRWIQAADNYVRLHLKERSVLLRETLAHLLDRLNAETFLRIHRSHAVNRAFIREWESSGHGDATLFLLDGQELAVSRNHSAALKQAFLDRESDQEA